MNTLGKVSKERRNIFARGLWNWYIHGALYFCLYVFAEKKNNLKYLKYTTCFHKFT